MKVHVNLQVKVQLTFSSHEGTGEGSPKDSQGLETLMRITRHIFPTTNCKTQSCESLLTNLCNRHRAGFLTNPYDIAVILSCIYLEIYETRMLVKILPKSLITFKFGKF